MKKWNDLYKEKKLDLMETYTKLSSWEGHAKNADTYYLRKHIREKCDWIC